MIRLAPNLYFFILALLSLSGTVAHSQSINHKHLDSLLKSGQNYKVLKIITSLDTLNLPQNELATFYHYKAKCWGEENKNAKAFLNFLKAKRIYLAIDSIDTAMKINLDIANLLSDEKNNRKKATTYLQEFLDYALQKKDYLLIAKAYSTWAAIIMEEEPLESFKLFKKSQFFSEKIQNFAK
ncbi:hypothetical protein, partial [Flavobacterium sp.]|uniref:hypothetical protein n=1 Tax=Flavobacterium sp. TaxID=239 RepID=UPI00262DCE63